MIDQIGIVGMGGMGRGIAEAAARAGLEVVLVKSTPGSVNSAREALERSLDRAVARGKVSPEERTQVLGRISLSLNLDALSRCDVIVESIIEELEPKLRLFVDLERRVAPNAVLASNTSSLPLLDIAQALKVPSRFLGLHFFSPAQIMKLVELSPTDRTYPAAVESALELIAIMGKTPVLVSPTSGYIVNRLMVPYLLDAISALESQLAPARSIDTAMRLGCGSPMGPLELADAIGLDVLFQMAKTMHRELCDSANATRYSPPAMLRRLVAKGQLGKKTGRGIYDYSVAPPRENPDLWPGDVMRIHA